MGSKLFEEILAEYHTDDLSIFLTDIEELFSQITTAAMQCFKLHLGGVLYAEIYHNSIISRK